MDSVSVITASVTIHKQRQLIFHTSFPAVVLRIPCVRALWEPTEKPLTAVVSGYYGSSV